MRNVRMVFLVMAAVVLSAVVNIASADTFGTGANQFTIDFVNISGDASNANGTNISQYQPGYDRYRTFTDPDNDYRIGTYEIANEQWNKFVNAYGTVTGSPSTAYDSTHTQWTGTNMPTNNVSWYEAAQFVNYLNTSTGHQTAYKFTGTQGASDYTFTPWAVTDNGYNASNPYRNSNAFYFVPTENEWVKAAYWNGTSIQTYANASAEDLVLGSPDYAKWNYDSAENEPWNVTSGIKELNGTYNMMGNVWEGLETPWTSVSVSRVVRGGSYALNTDVLSLSSSNWEAGNPTNETENYGFRVASIPEPTTLLLLGLGGLTLRRK